MKGYVDRLSAGHPPNLAETLVVFFQFCNNFHQTSTVCAGLPPDSAGNSGNSGYMWWSVKYCEIRRFIWEHALDVHRIMHEIECSGATFAASKAQICLPEVLIIGQQCNAQGREPDTAKVDKILSWPILKTPKEVRQFLGLCGTVRVWIPNYSKIVRPLSQLYHKNTDFNWTNHQQESFDLIKKLATSAPALQPIDYKSDRTVVLSVDSSKEAVGMILSQLDELHVPVKSI